MISKNKRNKNELSLLSGIARATGVSEHGFRIMSMKNMNLLSGKWGVNIKEKGRLTPEYDDIILSGRGCPVFYHITLSFPKNGNHVGAVRLFIYYCNYHLNVLCCA